MAEDETGREAFVIFRASGLTRRVGLEDFRDHSFRHLFTILDFLQRNGLAREPLIASFEDMNDDTELRSDQLTDEGIAFMRTGYQRWLAKLDRGGDPADYAFLDRQLRKMRDVAPTDRPVNAS